jgi:hypothetical protein
VNKLIAWIRQPTTITGLSALAGTAMGVATGSVKWPVALPLSVGSLVAMVLPDNSAAVQASRAATTDLLTLTESLRIKPVPPATSSVPTGGTITGA